MFEKLLVNFFTGDGILYSDLYLIYVDEVCGLFKFVGLSEDEVKNKVFFLFLRDKVLIWYRLCDGIGLWN